MSPQIFTISTFPFQEALKHNDVPTVKKPFKKCWTWNRFDISISSTPKEFNWISNWIFKISFIYSSAHKGLIWLDLCYICRLARLSSEAVNFFKIENDEKVAASKISRLLLSNIEDIKWWILFPGNGSNRLFQFPPLLQPRSLHSLWSQNHPLVFIMNVRKMDHFRKGMR